MTPAAWIAGKTVVVTGANAGIGKATAAALAAQGAHVTMACRDPARAEAARRDLAAAANGPVEIGPVDVVPLDLASLASVRDAAAMLRERRPIDVLVNNAGVAALGRRRTTADGFERQFGVNHLGHFLLTTLLLDCITSRIVNVSSAGYSLAKGGLRWDDVQWEHGEYDGWAAYGASKLCNLYFTWELADRLRERGVTANAAHPGFVDTELGYRRPEEGGKPRPTAPAGPVGGVDLAALGTPRTSEEGARTSVRLAAAPELAGTTGVYFDEQGEPAGVSAVAADRDASARLWELSERLVAPWR